MSSYKSHHDHVEYHLHYAPGGLQPSGKILEPKPLIRNTSMPCGVMIRVTSETFTTSDMGPKPNPSKKPRDKRETKLSVLPRPRRKRSLLTRKVEEIQCNQ